MKAENTWPALDRWLRISFFACKQIMLEMWTSNNANEISPFFRRIIAYNCKYWYFSGAYGIYQETFLKFLAVYLRRFSYIDTRWSMSIQLFTMSKVKSEHYIFRSMLYRGTKLTTYSFSVLLIYIRKLCNCVTCTYFAILKFQKCILDYKTYYKKLEINLPVYFMSF